MNEDLIKKIFPTKEMQEDFLTYEKLNEADRDKFMAEKQEQFAQEPADNFLFLNKSKMFHLSFPCQRYLKLILVSRVDGSHRDCTKTRFVGAGLV